MTGELLFVGTRAARPLAAELGAEVELVPEVVLDDGWTGAGALEAWRDAASGGPPAPRVVVAVWHDEPPARTDLVELGHDAWLAAFEAPFARWFAALAAGAVRCGDGGSVVAVVERPAPLDAAGLAGEAALADAVDVLARSLSKVHGPRGVRVNAVTTPMRVTPPPVAVPPPPLEGFPGSLRDVAGAVRLLLADDASGVTATALHADFGRSWR